MCLPSAFFEQQPRPAKMSKARLARGTWETEANTLGSHGDEGISLVGYESSFCLGEFEPGLEMSFFRASRGPLKTTYEGTQNVYPRLSLIHSVHVRGFPCIHQTVQESPKSRTFSAGCGGACL